MLIVEVALVISIIGIVIPLIDLLSPCSIRVSHIHIKIGSEQMGMPLRFPNVPYFIVFCKHEFLLEWLTGRRNLQQERIEPTEDRKFHFHFTRAGLFISNVNINVSCRSENLR